MNDIQSVWFTTGKRSNYLRKRAPLKGPKGKKRPFWAGAMRKVSSLVQGAAPTKWACRRGVTGSRAGQGGKSGELKRTED